MEAEKYFKKLKKMIENPPTGTRIIYDTHNMKLFVIKDGFEFIDKGIRNEGTSWHGVLTPVSEPNGSEGNVPESVVGGISVLLEAVMDGY